MTTAIVGAMIDQSPLALAVAFGGAWALGWHLAWQLARLDTENPEACLRLFRSNRDAGLIPVPFLAVAILL
jgi:4-hydroxybenzoate polyprenyltransferase